MNRSLSAGILAGGMSSRMGEDKRLLKIGNATMIERLVGEFASLSPVVSAPLEGLSFDTGCNVVCDENVGIGPIEGIRQLLTQADTDDVFCCAADMPFLTIEAAWVLAEFRSSDHDCWVFTENGRIQPLCGIYSKTALPMVEAVIREGRYAVKTLLSRVRTKMIKIEQTALDPRILLNINTQEDYLALQDLMCCIKR